MKNTLLFCLLIFAFSLQSQTASSDTLRFTWLPGERPEPTKTEVLVTFRVYDYHERPVTGIDLWVTNTGNQQAYQSATDDQGRARFLLPKGQPFRLDAQGAAGLKTFRTVNDKYVKSTYRVYLPQQDFTETTSGDTIRQEVSPAQTPTRERVRVSLTVIDLDQKPLEGEQVYFTAEKSGKIYVAHTNSRGVMLLMLPEGDTYCLGLTFEREIKCIPLPKSEMAGALRLTLTTIGTEAFLKRKAERERQLAIRDSLFQAQRLRDSLELAKLKAEDFLYQLERGREPEIVLKNIEEQAAKERDSLAKDDRYFEKSGKEVQAVLYRMRQEWQNKVIVTDVTCSMDPYLDQVLLWHALELTQNENNRYLFFNDGDGKPLSEKLPGQTGGIHATDAAQMQQLLLTMADTKSFGCSGDSPENDLEALLEGVKKMRGLDELVLIADNYSDVRDIELLTQLEVPVRVLLAGARNGANEQYLEIAYRTGGSVHTLEQDLYDLARLADGEMITIGSYKYRVNRGKFIRVSGI